MTVLIRPEGQTPDDMKLSRRAVGALGGLMFSGYAVAALAKEAEPVTTDDAGLTTETVSYRAPDGFDLPAYVARPEGDGPFPVVIVVSEIFGVHDYIRDVCRRLAKQGYAAIAPAFFVRVEDPAPLSDMQRIMQIVSAAGYDQVMGDISATLDWASQQLWANADKVGITGFCWGGTVVWRAAIGNADIRAGVAWYGRLGTVIPRAAELKAPVLGLYGGRDQGIPLASVERMRQALARAGQTGSEIVVYDDAPHGFHADYRASYAEADAKDGWSRLTALFAAKLKA